MAKQKDTATRRRRRGGLAAGRATASEHRLIRDMARLFSDVCDDFDQRRTHAIGSASDSALAFYARARKLIRRAAALAR